MMTPNRALLFSTTRNYQKISSIHDLGKYILANQLSEFLHKPVDLLPWQSLTDKNDIYSQYNEFILADDPDWHKSKSKYFKECLFFLDKLTGYKSSVYPLEVFTMQLKHYGRLKPFYNNDLTEGFTEWLNQLDSITVGDGYNYLFWKPGTHNILSPLQNWDLQRRAKTAVVFYGELYPSDKSACYTIAKNLFKKINKMSCQIKFFVLPLTVNGFEADFKEYFLDLASISDIKVLEAQDFNYKAPHSSSIWNLKYNVFNEKNYKKYKKVLH